MKKESKKSTDRLIASLSVLCFTPVFLLLLRVSNSDSSRYLFMIWNLLLGIIPVFLAWWLVERLKKHRWSHSKQLLLTAGWLLFLPNSFYLVTDFIHLRQTFEASLLFDVVLFTSFAVSGLIIGYISLFLVHNELSKRLPRKQAWVIVGLIFLASSFAIYLGRFSRWNTWDILLKPTGLLFDVSDRFLNPYMHHQTYETTLIFFVLLFPVYWVIWESIHYLKK